MSQLTFRIGDIRPQLHKIIDNFCTAKKEHNNRVAASMVCRERKFMGFVVQKEVTMDAALQSIHPDNQYITGEYWYNLAAKLIKVENDDALITLSIADADGLDIIEHACR